MQDDTGDEALMLRYRDGDAAAFDLLYARHRAPLYRYLRRLIGSSGALDEVFQEVWLSLINSRQTYQPSARFTTFLYRLAHNRAMDLFRKNGRTVATVDDGDQEFSVIDLVSAPPEQQPDSLLERKQRAVRLLAALDELPSAQREAFLLHEEGELDLEQIAQVTDCGRETVKSRLRYAVGKLRAALKGER